ncbi:MAG TPA: hypothetical protein VJN18_24500 [Polyangiaceae bacterium]|nr:hypothetical protein [Polyangiaceae bacterium]
MTHAAGYLEGTLALHSGMRIWLEGQDLEAIMMALESRIGLQTRWRRLDALGSLAARLVQEGRWAPADLWLLSTNLPAGFQRVAALRSQVTAPIVVVAAPIKAAERQAVDAGADAFCDWPDTSGALGSRVWALLRRASGIFRIGTGQEVKLLHAEQQLAIGQTVFQLTPLELRLLGALWQQLNVWVPPDALWSRLQEKSRGYDSSRLRTLFMRLRRKLGPHRWVLRSQRGKGTMMTDIRPDLVEGSTISTE